MNGYIVLLLCLLLCGGCIHSIEPVKNASVEQNKNEDVEEKDLNIIPLGIEIEIQNEYTPEYMLSISDAVVLASVESLDGYDLDINKVIGFTNGTASLKKVINGDIDEEIFRFKKPGCIVPLSELEKTYSEEEMKKINHLREENGYPENYENVYYDTTLSGDIHIETGKTYLMYLHYIQKLEEYEIIGLGNGLREIPNYSDDLQFNELEVINSKDNSIENLSDYIETVFQ